MEFGLFASLAVVAVTTSGRIDEVCVCFISQEKQRKNYFITVKLNNDILSLFIRWSLYEIVVSELRKCQCATLLTR